MSNLVHMFRGEWFNHQLNAEDSGMPGSKSHAERQASVGFKKPGEPMPQLGVEKKLTAEK